MHKFTRTALMAMSALLFMGWGFAATLNVDINDLGCDNITGTPYCDIQPALDNAAPGDTVHVADGTYVEALDITTSLTLEGASRDGTVIDASSFSDYGIDVTADNVTLHTFTHNGPDIVAYGYGIKVADMTNLTIDNVTVKESGRTQIDLNGVDNATITNVSLIDGLTAGAGLSTTDSNNTTIDTIYTSGNPWGGIAFYTYGTYYPPAGSDTISLTNHTFSEPIGMYTQEIAGAVTNLYAPQYACTLSSSELPVYTWYFESGSEAEALIAPLAALFSLSPDSFDINCGFTAYQAEDYNLIGDDHTITANIGYAFAGTQVLFEVDGVTSDSYTTETNSEGEATYTYSSTTAGIDIITVCIDQNNNTSCDTGEPTEELTKYWYTTYVHGGGHMLEKNGKRKNWADISFGGGVYDLGAEGYQGDWQVVLHNVGDNNLDKSTFHTTEITDMNWFSPNSSSCIGAMNFTAVGEFNQQPGYTLIVRAGDSGESANNSSDTIRITIEDETNTVIYDSQSDFPNESNCVGKGRTGLDKGNLTIVH